MTDDRSNKSFADEVRRLLAARGLSIGQLARAVDVHPSHLSRVLRARDYKTASPELARRTAVALGLPEDYFPEYRQAVVAARLSSDATLRDRLYDEFVADERGS